jgi:hypothetical protein
LPLGAFKSELLPDAVGGRRVWVGMDEWLGFGYAMDT